MNTLSFRMEPVGPTHSTSDDLALIRAIDALLSPWKILRVTICMTSRKWVLYLPENMTDDDQDILWAGIQEVDPCRFRATLVTETGDTNE